MGDPRRPEHRFNGWYAMGGIPVAVGIVIGGTFLYNYTAAKIPARAPFWGAPIYVTVVLIGIGIIVTLAIMFELPQRFIRTLFHSSRVPLVARLRRHSSFTVLRAHYGREDMNKVVDVTSIVQGRIDDGHLRMSATHGDLGIEDPAVAAVKELVIYYRMRTRGRTRVIRFIEGLPVDLP
jgi:hypothetical protein